MIFGFVLIMLGASTLIVKLYLFLLMALTLIFGIMLLVGADKRVAEQRKKKVEIGGMNGIIAGLEELRNDLHSAAERIRDKPKDPPPGISN